MNENQGNEFQQRTDGGNAPQFVTLLVLSILETCCCNCLTGIAGIILVILANSAYKHGDFENYESKRKICSIILIVGAILSVVINIALTVTGVATSLPMYNEVMQQMPVQ